MLCSPSTLNFQAAISSHISRAQAPSFSLSETQAHYIVAACAAWFFASRVLGCGVSGFMDALCVVAMVMVFVQRQKRVTVLEL